MIGSSNKTMLTIEDIKKYMKEENNEDGIFGKVIDNDISLVVMWGVSGCNPNGSPSNGMPRSMRDKDGITRGIISQVSINRRIRTALTHVCEGIRVFVEEAGTTQSAEEVMISNEAVCKIVHDLRDESNKKKKKDKVEESTEETATKEQEKDQPVVTSEMEGKASIIEQLCSTFLDLHLFGLTGVISDNTLSAIGCGKKGGAIVLPTSGPVKFCDAVTVNPLEMDEFGITKSYNGINDGKARSSDTMGGTFYKVKGNIYCSHLFISEGTAQTYRMTYGDLFLLMAALSETYRHDFSANRNSGVFYMGQIVAATSSNIFEKIEPNSLYNKVKKALFKKFQPYGYDVFGFSEDFDLTEEEGFKKAKNLAVMPKTGELLFYKPNRF